jgi:hypothetical protein
MRLHAMNERFYARGVGVFRHKHARSDCVYGCEIQRKPFEYTNLKTDRTSRKPREHEVSIAFKER